MTPAARVAAAIELLAAIEAEEGGWREGVPPRNGPLPPFPSREGRGSNGSRPADAVASDFFRARRFIGSGDRRAVSERVWRVLRCHRRLSWWLADRPTPRLLVAASLLLDGGSLADFSGGRFAPAPLMPSEQAALRRLEGRTLDHPSMPDAVRLEVPDWLAGRLRATELLALLEPAPLDLRVNLLKATRDEARAALAAEGIDAVPTPLSPWGLRIEGRRQVTTGPAFRAGLVEIQDEGSQLVAALVDARPGMRVADLCAGAGGKTLALAMTMQNRGSARRLRRLGGTVGRRGPPPAPRRRSQRRAPSAGSGRQVDQAARRDLRPCAGRCAVHRHRHLAAQSGRALAPDRGRPCRTYAKTGGDTRSGRVSGSHRRAFGLRYLLAAFRGERGPGD